MAQRIPRYPVLYDNNGNVDGPVAGSIPTGSGVFNATGQVGENIFATNASANPSTGGVWQSEISLTLTPGIWIVKYRGYISGSGFAACYTGVSSTGNVDPGVSASVGNDGFSGATQIRQSGMTFVAISANTIYNVNSYVNGGTVGSASYAISATRIA